MDHLTDHLWISKLGTDEESYPFHAIWSFDDVREYKCDVACLYIQLKCDDWEYFRDKC